MPDDATEEDVKNQMMRMVHSIFVSTETFMMHPSISKYGGYKLRILGASIWKVRIDKKRNNYNKQITPINKKFVFFREILTSMQQRFIKKAVM